MGLKTIQEKYNKDCKELEDTVGVFVKTASTVNDHLTEYKRLATEAVKLQEKALAALTEAKSSFNTVKGLKTHGLVELDSVKRLLLAAIEARDPYPIKLDDIRNLEKDCRIGIEKQLAQSMKAYVDSCVASWPPQVKPTMLFKHQDGRIFGIVKIENGPHGMFYTGWVQKGVNGDCERRSIRIAELSPKQGWKFLKPK